MDKQFIHEETLKNIKRMENILDRRIGDVFDNEAVMEAFREEKVLSSLRLVMEDRDVSDPPVYTYDSEGNTRIFRDSLIRVYSKAEDQVLNRSRLTYPREYLKSCTLLEKDDLSHILKCLQRLRRSADRLEEHFIFKAARLYHGLITDESFDFPFSDVFARFYLYIYLVECDNRLAGLPLEMEFLSRSAEHDLVAASDEDSVALFISDCIISSLYMLASVRTISKRRAEAARNYLLTLVEEGRRFNCRSVAEKLGCDESTAYEILIKPASASEGFTVFLDSRAREEYLILCR